MTPERGQTPRIDVAAATVVLEKTDLAGLPAEHPSEIMTFLPGFHMARPQFYAGRPVASARGFFGGGEAEYILLLVDGTPVADVESGLIDWSSVSSSAIRRVEASRGPGASLYGDSAIGGVVQIFTDRAVNGGEVTATGGSFDTFTGDGSYARRFRAAGVSVSAAARSTDGAFQHSSARETLAAGGTDGIVGGFSWRWNASAADRWRDDPGALARDVFVETPLVSDPLYEFDRVDRQDFSTAFQLSHNTSSWQPHVRMYVKSRDEDLVRTILLAPGFGDRHARVLSTGAVGGSLEGQYTFASSRPTLVRFGVDLAREQQNTWYYPVDTDGKRGLLESESSGHRNRAGIFASASWEVASRVRVTGALRWDDVDDGSFRNESVDAQPQRALSPRLGVVYRLNDNGSATVFGQVSRAFKVPTLDQLFDPRPYPDFSGGTFTISNPNLVPQRAVNIEGGVTGGGRVRWSALAYRMNVEDEIDFDVRTFSYANIGQSRHTGLELESETRWKRLRTSLAYSLSRVTDRTNDDQLKNVPRHGVAVNVGIDMPWAFETVAHYRRTWQAFLDDENQLAIDGPSVFDLRVRRQFGRHAVFVDILNATDDRYEEYGFTLPSFSGEEMPYVYPGAPRAIRIGWTMNF